MSSPLPPITDVIILSQASKTPNDFCVVRFSQDTQDDADLWRDSFFSRKTYRYLAFSRFPPKSTKVLTEIVVKNDSDYVDPLYNSIHQTHDTSEKALKKKIIGCKFEESPKTYISDIAIFASKRTTPGYVLIGEISNFHLAVKYDVMTQPPSRKTSQRYSLQREESQFEPNFATIGRQTKHPLDGVPIEINLTGSGSSDESVVSLCFRHLIRNLPVHTKHNDTENARAVKSAIQL